MAVLQPSNASSTVVSPTILLVESLILPPFSPLSKMDSHLPALLDELLDDCFQYSVDPKCLCDTRARFVQGFHRFLTERHTHENLEFVIEIFRYEYFFDKIHPENVELQKVRSASRTHKQFSSSFLNQSLEHFIDSLPYPTSAMRKVHKIRTSDSELSLSGFLQSDQFGFEFDDFNPHSSNAWQNFKDQNVSSDDSSRGSLSLSPLDPEGLLNDQWDYIVKEFISINSPQQVNLNSKTVKEILAEDAISGIHHNPIVLIKAKLEVIQLLEENAYAAFLRSQKTENSFLECNGPCQFDAIDASMMSMGINEAPVNKKVLDADVSRSTLPSPLPRPLSLRGGCTNTQVKSALTSPLPQSRIKTKFLSHFSTNSENSSSASSISSFMQHFRSNSGSSTRGAVSVPHSGLNTQAHSPVNEIPRPSSTVHESLSLLGKLMRKKK